MTKRSAPTNTDAHDPECYPRKDSHAMDCPYRMSGGRGPCDCRMSQAAYRRRAGVA